LTDVPPASTAKRRRGARAVAALALALVLAGCSSLVWEETMPVGATLVGAYVPSGVWNDLGALRALEAEVGRSFDIAHWFSSWDVDFDPVPVHDVLDDGRMPLISWQPHRQGVRDIAAGVYDDYVRAWARGVADAPGVVYLRPFPEMNGDWVPWNGDPDGLKAAWRHVAAIFAAEGADNVRWVFSPNVTDEPRVNDNRMEQYYPGDDVVDVLALSGYNWGATRPYIGWRSFEEIFHTAYPRITALGPQPLWIAEVASTEEGGEKGAWIREMLGSTAFPRLGAVVWFNEDKETDWRLESSEASLQAFRDWFRVEAQR
jgi:mannan endo-1,4-beta-mannosidase